MTEPADEEKFDHITTAAHLGSLLRRLRGDRTQQNITDHAKRQNFYVHRPDLSAIERGRRLPTANELRGILYGCGRMDLFDRLDGVRQHLMEQPADAPTSHDAPLRVSYLPAEEPGAFPVRPRDLDRARPQKLIIAMIITTIVVITTMIVLVSRVTNTSTQPLVTEAPPPHLDTSYAPGGAGKTTYQADDNHYQIYDTKGDRRAVAVIFYQPDRPSDFVGFQSCHEGSGSDCPGDLPGSVTGLLCMKTGVGLGSHPAGYTFGEQVCVPNA